MTTGFNDATRILAVIDSQIKKLTRSGAKIDVTYGQVAGVSGQEASVYIAGSRELAISAGETPEPSEGFRIPSHFLVGSGNYVRVSIDERGHRWIDEVLPTTTYAKVAIDQANGQILTGDGTAEPSTPLGTSAAPTFTRVRITGTDDVTLTSTLHGFQIGEDADANLAIDINEVQARVNGSAAPLYLNNSGGQITTGSGGISTTGSISATGTVGIRKASNVARIDFPVSGGNDPGYIEHIENPANVAEMRFSVSDDPGNTDFFSFGATVGGFFNEGARIYTDGTALFDGVVSASGLNITNGIQTNNLATAAKRIRYVPIVPVFTINGSTTVADIANAASPEITGLPTSGVAYVVGIIMVRTSDTSNANMQAKHYDTEDEGGITYSSGVAGRGGNGFFIARPGGTNNRQIKYSVDWVSGTVTYYLRPMGYFTYED